MPKITRTDMPAQMQDVDLRPLPMSGSAGGCQCRRVCVYCWALAVSVVSVVALATSLSFASEVQAHASEVHCSADLTTPPSLQLEGLYVVLEKYDAPEDAPEDHTFSVTSSVRRQRIERLAGDPFGLFYSVTTLTLGTDGWTAPRTPKTCSYVNPGCNWHLVCAWEEEIGIQIIVPVKKVGDTISQLSSTMLETGHRLADAGVHGAEVHHQKWARIVSG